MNAPEIAGYTFIRPLGAGGQADVYLYAQDNPSRKVAIKVLRNETNQKEYQSLFAQEASITTLLTGHPHIINIYETSITQDGRLYIALEYCDYSLADVLRARQLSLMEILEYSINLCDALYLSHKNKILHKDIKPRNIFLNKYDVLVLSDFGIASRAEKNTKSAFSIKWAAPEIINNKATSNYQAEIYSIGLTIYTMISNINPFDNCGDISKTKSNILSGKINYKIVRQDIPDELLAVIKKATALNAENRYANAYELIKDLHNIQDKLGLTKTKVFSTKDVAKTADKQLSYAIFEPKDYKVHNENDTNRKYKMQSRSKTIDVIAEKANTKLNVAYMLLSTATVIIILLIGVLLF